MRYVVVLAAFVAAASVAFASDIASRELVGTWFGGAASQGDSRFTFRVDGTFDGIDGDAISAGRWKLHRGNKLELIYYSDYERKIISRSSGRAWIIITPVTAHRIKMAHFDEDLSPGFQIATARVWMKQR